MVVNKQGGGKSNIRGKTEKGDKGKKTNVGGIERRRKRRQIMEKIKGRWRNRTGGKGKGRPERKAGGKITGRREGRVGREGGSPESLEWNLEVVKAAEN